MKILHISDLHFGHHDSAIAAGFADDINAQKPDLVVASGDFTQIGSKDEFELARDFLDKLEARVFAVPGNHDVPAVNILRRFFDPYGLYKRYIDRNLEPFLEMDGVVLVGMRTSRRARKAPKWRCSDTTTFPGRRSPSPRCIGPWARTAKSRAARSSRLSSIRWVSSATWSSRADCKGIPAMTVCLQRGRGLARAVGSACSGSSGQ